MPLLTFRATSIPSQYTAAAALSPSQVKTKRPCESVPAVLVIPPENNPSMLALILAPEQGDPSDQVTTPLIAPKTTILYLYSFSE